MGLFMGDVDHQVTELASPNNKDNPTPEMTKNLLSNNLTKFLLFILIVPTLCVGMPPWTLLRPVKKP